MSKTASTNPQLVEPEATLPRRRSFTAEYKAAIVEECDAAKERGDIGAILRREGLYSSHLVDWRRRRTEGGHKGLAPQKTGRPPMNPAVRNNVKELERLRRENAALEQKLERSQIIVEAQKKLAEVLASLAPPSNESSE